MISMDQVSFRYGTAETGALQELNLQIRPGECLLLCGESGCGKTTVTKLINGLIPHFTEDCTLSGTVTTAGLPVARTELYELAKHVGSVFQNPKSQFFNLDTDSELAFGLENAGAPPAQIEARVMAATKDLELGPLLNRNIFTLSGGEKQTLAFGSVYAMDPEIYVLDEPTANLDGAAIERLRGQILQLKRQGRTIVIAEHRLYFLADLIDRAVYIRQGRIEGCYTGAQFRALSQAERVQMGLRATTPTELALPPARQDDAPDAKQAGLRVEDLSAGYKKQPDVFTGLSFTALPGEVLAITGRNGVGKTTLTRCLCGLMKARGGRILLNGVPLAPKQRCKASFCVMQDVNHQLFFDSVENECEQAARDDTAQIEPVLAAFDLLPFKESHPMALSGGQKQRLAVATAVLSGKRLLIFDEPTSGLDYRHMREVCAVVRRLAQAGHIVLIVSHDAEFMQSACDRVLQIG